MKEAQDIPVVTMLRMIIERESQIYYKHQQDSTNRFHVLTPWAVKEISHHLATAIKFEVQLHQTEDYSVIATATVKSLYS